ncbi:MAG: acyl-CoA dehydrogenase [Candidatus Hydrogenedens sp.]|nr:acyl-CoA dehydrogenase [Candidatus Hydrogenedens sp.]
MQLTPEHDQIRETVRKFVEAEINPHVDEWEKAGMFPAHEVFKKLGDLGLLGISKPEAYGGMGLDYSYQAVMNEALGWVNCGAIPMAIGVQTDMCTPAMARFGSEAVCNKFLAPSIAGDFVGCIGVSEVGAGSDVANIKTRATKVGGEYVINGGKMWITNGTQGDWICLLVNTGDENTPKYQDKSIIAVPLRENGELYKGVTIERKLEKMGMRSSDTAELHFENVVVPEENLVGQEGAGFMYQMLQFQEERMYLASSCLTMLERTVNDTIEYTRHREVFGKPLLDNQVVHFRLAELMTEIEALRAMTWKAIGIHVDGGDCTMLASMCKLKAGRLIREVNDSCLQYWGGMGFMDETLISRTYRDGRLASIGGGADEVMLSIICKLMNTLPSKRRG